MLAKNAGADEHVGEQWKASGSTAQDKCLGRGRDKGLLGSMALRGWREGGLLGERQRRAGKRWSGACVELRLKRRVSAAVMLL